MQRKHVVILSQVHVAGRGSREGSLKPADALASSGPLPIFKQTLQDECCRIGDTIVLSCRGKLINNYSLYFYFNIYFMLLSICICIYGCVYMEHQ